MDGLRLLANETLAQHSRIKPEDTRQGINHKELINSGISDYNKAIDYIRTDRNKTTPDDIFTGLSVKQIIEQGEVTPPTPSKKAVNVWFDTQVLTDAAYGDRWDTAFSGVKVKYEDGTVEELTSGYTVDPEYFPLEGSEGVHVELSYQDVHNGYSVRIGPKGELASYYMDKTGDTTIYVAGDEIILEDLIFSIVRYGYQVENLQLTEDNCIVTDDDGNVITHASGNSVHFEVSSDYGNLYTTIDVVPEELVSGIGITQFPDKMDYQENETLDLTGMIIGVSYNTGRYVEITDGYTSTPSQGDALSVVDTTVTVEYEGEQTNFNITVNN